MSTSINYDISMIYFDIVIESPYNQLLQNKKTMKKSPVQPSLQTTSVKTTHFPQTTRCFDSTHMNSIEINLANHNFEEGEEYVLPIVINEYDVVDIFALTATQMKLQLIEKQSNYATAVIKNSKKTSFSDYFGCLAWWNPKAKATITGIKITLHTNKKFQNQDIKLCRVKMIGCPNQELKNQFVKVFREKIEKIDGIYKGPFPFDFNSPENRIQENTTNPFELEACAYFMIHRLISDVQNQWGIKAKFERSLVQFTESFKNIKESSQSLPTPMVNAVEISREIADQIRLKIPKSNQQYQLMFPYLRIAVEKHLFDQIGGMLNEIYFESTENQSQIYSTKSAKIMKQLSIDQIFAEILLPPQLQLVRDLSLVEQKSISPLQKRQNIIFAEIAHKFISLDNLIRITNIREKIKCCQIMYAELKSLFFEKLNKKYQLNSMEDIIPVLIVVILFCGGVQSQERIQGKRSLRAQFNMMIDYIQTNGEEFEAEKRLIVNLSESYNYIVRDWNI